MKTTLACLAALFACYAFAAYTMHASFSVAAADPGPHARAAVAWEIAAVAGLAAAVALAVSAWRRRER